MKNLAIFIFFLIIFNSSFAQNYQKIDSLKKLLLVFDELKIEQKIKNDILLALFDEYQQSSYDTALHYAKEGLKTTQEMNSKKLNLDWYSKMGILYKYHRIYNLSLNAYAKVLRNLRKTPNSDRFIGWTLLEVGNIYYILEDYKKAHDIYFETIKYFEKINDIFGKSVATSNIGLSNLEQNKFSEALLYFRKACFLNKKTNKNISLAYNYGHIGLTFNKLDQIDSADYYFQKALVLIDQEKSANSKADIQTMYTLSLLKMEKNDSAISVMSQAINSCDAQVEKQKLALYHQILAKAYAAKQDYKNALTVLLKSLDIDSRSVINTYKIKPYIDAAEYYFKLEEYKNAYIMLKKHNSLRDEIFNENVWENTYSFEKERTDSEKKYLIQDINIKEAEKKLLKLQIIAGISLIVFLSIFILLITKRNAMRKKANILLEEKNKLINDRNYELTLKNKKISDQNIELNFKQEQIKRLLQKYETQKHQSANYTTEHRNSKLTQNRDYFSLSNQIHEVILLHDKKLSSKQIEVVKKFEEIDDVFCNKEEMISVWSNLLENSINAISLLGKITIQIINNQDFITIKFIDTGIGIEKTEYENIFKPFVSYSKNAENKGLGLYIVKKIIEKHGGKISVESEPNIATCFKIELPKYQPVEI